MTSSGQDVRHVPAVYWFAVSMVAVFGTMAADGAHKALGVPYAVTSIFYAVAVAILVTLVTCVAIAGLVALGHRGARDVQSHATESPVGHELPVGHGDRARR